MTAKNNSLAEGASVVELDNASKIKQYFSAHFSEKFDHKNDTSKIATVVNCVKSASSNQVDIMLSNGYIVKLSCWTPEGGIWKVLVLPNNQNKERKSFADVLTDHNVALEDAEERCEKVDEEKLAKNVENNRKEVEIVEEKDQFLIRALDSSNYVSIRFVFFCLFF